MNWTIDTTGAYYKPCIRENGHIVCYLPDNSAALVLETDRKAARRQTQADARLIAAAPDLLAALAGLLSISDRYTGVGLREIDAARAAIRKATEPAR